LLYTSSLAARLGAAGSEADPAVVVELVDAVAFSLPADFFLLWPSFFP